MISNLILLIKARKKNRGSSFFTTDALMARDDDYIGLRRFSCSLLCVSAFFFVALCVIVLGEFTKFSCELGEKKWKKFSFTSQKTSRTKETNTNKHDDDDVAHRFLLVGLDQSSTTTTTKAKEEQQQQQQQSHHHQSLGWIWPGDKARRDTENTGRAKEKNRAGEKRRRGEEK